MLVILYGNCGFYGWAIYKTVALWSDITMQYSVAYNSCKNDVYSGYYATKCKLFIIPYCMSPGPSRGFDSTFG